MDLTELVVLRYASNPCYVEVVSPECIKGLELNLVNGVYSFGGYTNIPIGNSIKCSPVLGVYNKHIISHLDNMVHQATEITRTHSYFDD